MKRRSVAIALAVCCAALNAPGAQAQDHWETEAQATVKVVGSQPMDEHGNIQVDLQIHNTGTAALQELSITTRRGNKVDNLAQARAELDSGAFPFFGIFVPAGSLGPGEETKVSITVPTALGEEGTLAIVEPGEYPVMFTLTGTQDGAGVALDDTRFVLATPQAPAREGAARQLNFIYPITAVTDIVAGETGGEKLILRSEQLAGQLAEGGRLDQLVDAYLDTNAQGGCIAIDPALLDTAGRMAQGYTVKSTRPAVAQKPQRLRDSWFKPDPTDRGEDGTGSAAAAAWIERLRGANCIMAMPWANTDINAVARTNNASLMTEALTRGNEVATAVLGRGLDTDLVLSSTPHAVTGAAPLVVADDAVHPGDAALYSSDIAALLGDTSTTGLSSLATIRLATSPAEPDAPALVATLPAYQTPQAAKAFLSAFTTAGAGGGGIGSVGREPGNGIPEVEKSFTDPQIQQVQQQARYTDELTAMMVNDPAIALTRYGFTLPLRRDLLMAMSRNRGGSLDTERLAAQSTLLQELRNSVALIPPGNVYTRTSESSPLLIVAENGLPLPVEATMAYESADAQLATPPVIKIPAKGSITVSMTAQQADTSGSSRSDIRLWLATPTGATISQPVIIAVQTRGGMLGLYGLGAIAALLAAGAVFMRLRRKDNKNS